MTSIERVASAQRLADEELFPLAQDIDQAALLPRDRFDALRRAGLFDLSGFEPGVVRRTIAAVSSGCGATFFSWVQHHGVLRVLAGSANDELRAAWLPRLRSGEVLGGTAFAHMRRVGAPAVRATRVDGGWQLDGFAPWATSWGLAEMFTIGAESDNGEVVWTVISGVEQPGLTVVPLHLSVFSSTGTVAFAFDGLFVPDSDIAGVQSAETWRRMDRQRSAPGQPPALGVAARAIDLLRSSARGDADLASTAADRLTERLAATWLDDDVLVTASAGGVLDEGAIAAASDHRTRCLALASDATTALFAAVGGRGMDVSNPAQRLAREAAFYVIQAQTGDGRAATLRSMGSVATVG